MPPGFRSIVEFSGGFPYREHQFPPYAMVYGYSWKLLGCTITLYMTYALNLVRGFWDVSFLVEFFTGTTFDLV